MIVVLTTITLFLGVSASSAQLVKQCSCKEVEPCTNKFMNSWKPCLDQCQNSIAKTGANYQKLKQCIFSKQSMMQAAIRCTQSQNANACARGAPKMVPKRYPEKLEIASMAEINRMINKMGLASKAKSLLDAGKSMFGCVKKCMAKKSQNCDKHMKCSLALPADSVVVQRVKQCAISSGFNTATAQQLCNCAAKAGVKGLSGGVCSKIRIS